MRQIFTVPVMADRYRNCDVMVIVFASCEADLYRTDNVMVIVFASCEADPYRTCDVMVIVFASCETDLYRTCDVMVIVFASCAADREFDFRSGQTRNYAIGICCFFSRHTVLMSKSKDWLVRNQDVSEWSDMSTCGLVFQ